MIAWRYVMRAVEIEKLALFLKRTADRPGFHAESRGSLSMAMDEEEVLFSYQICHNKYSTVRV